MGEAQKRYYTAILGGHSPKHLWASMAALSVLLAVPVRNRVKKRRKE
ncbi:MAG: hypothetical protein ACYC0O_06835 [Desulfurivibrionaceae bacterium]|jgi:hypothetical protein|nr:hypothetical protein [Pseudomonadota bacterium]MCG2823723.1 hypothetical protein [Desulfobulbaceae bacterium]MDP2001538.1 hypothetical protein [Desulfurivibrionaceae bacterium]MBU4228691.1 hypothetical protein [Pseudomonadota bacterium]MBU4412867.1 hypothetical protein [Pseudomonadota bacterium]